MVLVPHARAKSAAFMSIAPDDQPRLVVIPATWSRVGTRLGSLKLCPACRLSSSARPREIVTHPPARIRLVAFA
jgi:hypothetical protein